MAGHTLQDDRFDAGQLHVRVLGAEPFQSFEPHEARSHGMLSEPLAPALAQSSRSRWRIVALQPGDRREIHRLR